MPGYFGLRDGLDVAGLSAAFFVAVADSAIKEFRLLIFRVFSRVLFHRHLRRRIFRYSSFEIKTDSTGPPLFAKVNIHKAKNQTRERNFKQSVGMGRNFVAKKDSKIEGLAVSAVFSAKLFV